MPSIFDNWKTSLAGVATVLGALSTIASMASTGQVDPNHLWMALTSIAGGIGLLTAQDAKKNS